MLPPERLHAARPVERKEHASLVGSPLIAGAAAYEIWRVHGATVPAVHHSLPEPGREADADWVNEQQRCVLLVALGGRPMAERQPPAVVVVKVERWGAEQSGTGAAEQTHMLCDVGRLEETRVGFTQKHNPRAFTALST